LGYFNLGDLFVKFFDRIGRIFSDARVLYGLIVALAMLPLGLLIVPTLSSTSAAEVAKADSDPMLNLVSTHDVEIEQSVSAPVVGDGQIMQPASQSAQASTTRVGNYLSIPGKVSSAVVAVGIGADGAIEVPSAAVGIYSQGGATFLDGHSMGVFAGLARVRVGDIVDFTLNSATTQYQVANVVTYTYFNGESFDQSFMYDSLYTGGANGLNMMTCAGAYLPAYGTYSHRIVVYSVRI
jgi:sortase (surface protein transpeptidase)